MYKIDKITKEKQKVTRTWKIISIIIYILIIPILIINFTLIIKSFINPNETPSILGYKNYIIVSGSMEPTIMTGDSIFVKEVPQNEIKINDIISFQDGNIITTHRIIKIEEENGIKKYTTKGDNNNIEDNYEIKKEEILGKVCFHIKKIGNIVSYIKSRKGFINVIILIIILFLIKNKIDSKKITRKEKRKKYEIKKLRDQYYSK